MFKKALLNSLHSFSSLVPLKVLQGLSRQHFLTLFYHTISDRDLPHIKHLYKVRDSQLFKQDLEYMLCHYTPISLEDIIDFVHQGKALPKRAFHLTFDDGLSECYHVIAPILKEKGIPATFFINSDFVNNKDLMFRYKASLLVERLAKASTVDHVLKPLFARYQLEYKDRFSLLNVRWNHSALLDEIAVHFDISFSDFLKKEQPYLNHTEIQAMLQDGFTFGSHSQNHPTYNILSLEDQITQTINSQTYINQNFTVPYKVFAFPFTDIYVSKAFFDRILTQEGFELSFGGAGLKHEQINGQLQRIGIEKNTLQSLKTTIHSEYCYYLIKAFFLKNTIKRQ